MLWRSQRASGGKSLHLASLLGSGSLEQASSLCIIAMEEEDQAYLEERRSEEDMHQNPNRWATEYENPFKPGWVGHAYHNRPPYHPEFFETLTGPIKEAPNSPRHVLDVGCGTGYIARYFVDPVE